MCVWLDSTVHVVILRAAAAFSLDLRQRAGLPAAKELADVVLELRPVDLAGDAEDRAARRIALLPVAADVGHRQAGERCFASLAGCGPRARHSAAGAA